MTAKLCAAVMLILLLTPGIVAGAEEAAVYTVTINYDIQNTSSNTARDFEATIYLYDNISGWADQRVLAENIFVDGVPVSPQIFKDEDNRWTKLQLGELGPHQSKRITVTQTLKIKTVDFKVDPSLVGTTIPPELAIYTTPVQGLWESDDSRISALAAELVENAPNVYYEAENIFRFVIKYLQYKRLDAEHGALYAYLTKVGDCTEYSNLFVALARAAGIPAKVVAGNGYLPIYNVGGSADFSATGHAWAIFYLPDYGWVPVDGVWPTGKGSFARADYSHIAGATTDGSNAISGGKISWPGPGSIKTNWSYLVNRPVYSQEIVASASGTITPQVMLDVKLTSSPQISTEGTLVFTATVQNLGSVPAKNLLIDLNLDSRYFEVKAGEVQKGELPVGGKWVVPITVLVKDAAYGENFELEPTVTFEASYGGVTGEYIARGALTLSVGQKPAIIGLPLDLTMILIIAVLVVSIISVAIIARR
ncbi:MAG: transglutaminase domain-containing protein [Candidatus Hadarchaeales archaeon]